ncbi:2OG-Fe(II) oxygenase [Achlya hypogyna]|uniref:2OG-Fe(II) oxygenase n=1 Tax=Achlya hypogyna TaxID=1202772 RepID=A0A1V9Z419_ACHHY|nr:2OG-Fe(II) oxygenase [Achlya hypogyna]
MQFDPQGIAIVDLSQPAAEVARAVAMACASSGCFHIVHHGVSPELQSRVWAEMTAFFTAPLAAKRAVAPTSATDDRGYSSFGSENVAAFMGRKDEPNDPVEKFAFSHPGLATGDVHARPNVWPTDCPSFRTTMEAYYHAVKAVSAQLFAHFAAALQVDPVYFASRVTTAPDSVKLNYYPPTSGAVRRFAEHTDSVPFTILLMDGTPDALHVRTQQGWVPVAPLAGGLFVNLGDVLQRWTNDRWVATPHRVDAPATAAARKSIAYFVMLNGDAVIECIPSCAKDAAPKYAPVTFAGFVQEKMQRLVGA